MRAGEGALRGRFCASSSWEGEMMCNSDRARARHASAAAASRRALVGVGQASNCPDMSTRMMMMSSGAAFQPHFFSTFFPRAPAGLIGVLIRFAHQRHFTLPRSSAAADRASA